MGSNFDKAKGMGNEVSGKAKQAVGKATNNASLHGEGIAQERKGEGQKFAGKAKEAVKKTVDNL